MADEIRGLSIRFDANFSEFRKSMKSADKDINSTKKQLKDLQNSLQLKWDSAKFTKAQEQAQKALEATETKAELLRKRLQAMEEAGVTDETRDEYNYLSEQLNKTELDAQRLQGQLKDLNNIRLNNLTAGLDKVVNKANAAANATRGLSTAATAALAGLGALTLKTVEQADEVATLATQYNMSTDAIQRFQYVALQTDTSAEYLYKGLVKVQAGVADLSTGVTSVATKALEQLGLSFDQFDGAEDQFYGIIQALSQMEDQAKMVSLANDIFGEKMAINLFPLIYAGTDAINEYKDEFAELGALTEDQVFELAEFDNVLNQLKTQYTNVGLQLGSTLLPVLERLSEVLMENVLPKLEKFVAWFDRLSPSMQNFVLGALAVLAVLSPTLKLFGSMGGAISTLIKWISQLDVATLKLYASWGLVFAAISTVFTLLANWSNMNPVQKIVGLLGSLTAVALAAGIAMGVFQSALSWGLAAAGIVAGITAVTAAVSAAGKAANSSTPSASTIGNNALSSISVPEYSVPNYTQNSSSVSTTENNYVDNSNISIVIEKNDYMSEDDIIKAVNKGLKQYKQART